MDEEIISEFVAWGMSLGCREERDPYGKTSLASRVTMRGPVPGRGRRKNAAKDRLRALGVLGSKHIPQEYVVGTLEERLDLLAGIVDTDGYLQGVGYTVTQKDRALAQQVRFIAGSCGFRTSLRLKLVSVNGEKRPYWDVAISGDITRIPVRLERKRATKVPTNDWLWGTVEVEEDGEGEYAGFLLDGDHLFLLADFTVTHNSYFFADNLIERCLSEPTRAVGIREVQKSLDLSVKQLLEDRIRFWGLEDEFRFLRSHIECLNGGIISFMGMQDRTAAAIRSLEGYDIAWVEEAQSLSQDSLDTLRPTLRKPGSELWFSWNPREEDDPVDVFFRGPKGGKWSDEEIAYRVPPRTVLVRANWMDNPWFSDDSREEMEYDRRRDPDKYKHIWLGEYLAIGEARVFSDWRIEEFDTPDDVRFFLGADWGFGDPSVLVRCFLSGDTLFVDYEAYRINCPITQLPGLFDTVPGSRKWPIRADSARPETIDYMRSHGFPKMTPSVKGKGSVEEGVEFLKSKTIVVHPRCRHTSDELSLYSYKVDKKTNDVLPILEDKQNHCIAEGEIVECLRGAVPIEQVTTDDLVLTRGGYRQVLFSGCTDVDRDVVEVITSAGSFRCTPDHEIWTSSGFTRADALRYGTELITLGEVPSCRSGSQGSCGMVMPTDSTPTQIICRVLSEERRTTFTAMCGSFIRGVSQRVTRFITSTRISSITRLIILSALPRLSTPAGTHSQMSDWGFSELTWTEYGLLQRRGTPARRGSRFTGRTELRRTSILFPNLSRVTNAARSLLRGLSGIVTGSARTGASLLIAGPWVSTMRDASVRNAESRSQLISIAIPRLVLGHVETVQEAGRSARVYDLTVEGSPEFFVNGILVHNCIDSLRYGLEGERLAPRLPQISQAARAWARGARPQGDADEGGAPQYAARRRVARTRSGRLVIRKVV